MIVNENDILVISIKNAIKILYYYCFTDKKMEHVELETFKEIYYKFTTEDGLDIDFDQFERDNRTIIKMIQTNPEFIKNLIMDLLQEPINDEEETISIKYLLTLLLTLAYSDEEIDVLEFDIINSIIEICSFDKLIIVEIKEFIKAYNYLENEINNFKKSHLFLQHKSEILNSLISRRNDLVQNFMECISI